MWFSNRGTRDHWLRTQRLAAYVAFQRSVTTYCERAQLGAQNDIDAELAGVSVLGPDDVASRATGLVEAAAEMPQKTAPLRHPVDTAETVVRLPNYTPGYVAAVEAFAATTRAALK